MEPSDTTETHDESTLEGGSYEVLRLRLLEQGGELARKVDTLNARRKQVFGGQELQIIGNERIRTENNCVPIDILSVGEMLVFGYRVYIGLKSEVQVSDVFSVQRFAHTAEGAFEFSPLALQEAGEEFLVHPRFVTELKELYEYYAETRLQQLRRVGNKLLAVFQIGTTPNDVRVFRWTLGSHGAHPVYIDNRGERDHVFPQSHDFKWTVTTREDQVQGHHPHVSIQDEVFVETVGGDLTIKIEDNTEDGLGIYREPVEDENQALDDAQIHYARVGQLFLLKVLPYREERWRYFVFNRRTQRVQRIDAVGQACVSLPEDQGIIFPGGYYLQSGERKVFEERTEGLEFHMLVKSPNGEDVLYSFLNRADGHYVLLPYNVIRKEVQNPIGCHGFSLYDDGKMVLFRAAAAEATRVHPMQIWQTPFCSPDHEAASVHDGSYVAKVGNADLVRGIADGYSVRRLTETEQPTRHTFEDLVGFITRMVDAYYWLGHAEVDDMLSTLKTLRQTTELIVDEFEKVEALRQRALDSLEQSRTAQLELARRFRPQDLRSVEGYMEALTALRSQRGHLITLREMRYADLAALEQLDQQAAALFDTISSACVEFLLTDEALLPLTSQLDQVLDQIDQVQKRTEVDPMVQHIDELAVGLNLLSEVAGGLQVEDATARTHILEGISEIFAQLNRVRATLDVRRREILGREGRAEFAAQFKLLAQSVDSALGRSDTPEACDDNLSRMMLQLEEIEGRFSEFDEFVTELARKREEIHEAFGGRKQTLVEERQRRAQNLMAAADRILEGAVRRARTLKTQDELNAYFASDPMLLKLRELITRLQELDDSVKADELESRLKSARQDALRLMRDRSELFDEGQQLIRLGRHRFSVNTQPLELTMVPRDGAMVFHLTGTDYYSAVQDPAFAETSGMWDQTLVSETPRVYRGEYLAAALLLDAEQGRGHTVDQLQQARLSTADLLALVRQAATERYDEGYERGVHDVDATAILQKLLDLRATAGLLRFPPACRALGCLVWAFFEDGRLRDQWQRRARSLDRLRKSLSFHPAIDQLGAEIGETVTAFAGQHGLPVGEGEAGLAGRYLLQELMRAEDPAFVTSVDAERLRSALTAHIESSGASLEDDLAGLAGNPGQAMALARAWLEAFTTRDAGGPDLSTAGDENPSSWVGLETAALLVCGQLIERRSSAALTHTTVQGLLGQHPRLVDGTLDLRLDEFLHRLTHHSAHVVPCYREYRRLRQQLLDHERRLLRLEELKPRVLTSFVRNRLISEVYLPLIGDNLAKQLGAAGAAKRTDLMGMLLLVSPPGYGKTTLMEYLASQLGLVFIKVNGPALGHGVTSLDPAEARSATARQEVEKINLAFEMGNNVMLYLDDIQHTSSELLQKFISLCDAQRRVEGVWSGQTRTYDLRGKKFCMVMAGNPYTESGDRFQIPDMLANRADTYNLGDILSGKDDLFALSYIENALTSSSTLAPLASRDPQEVQLLVRMARGEEIPESGLKHPYSASELTDIRAVLQHLFQVQQLLLRVNQQYIASAGQEDAYRTEPPFQLQGSYRNMNKLAEKIVPALNQEELTRLITDHYVSEAQTLTTGAEHNLLKLAELRGTLTPEQSARWDAIRDGFRRKQRLGGSADDPAVRVVAQLGDIGERLEGIRAHVELATAQAAGPTPRDATLNSLLHKLDGAMDRLQRPKIDINVDANLPPGFSDLLDQQTAVVERVLLPLVHTVTRSLEEGDSLRLQLMALIDDLKRMDQRLKQLSPEELRALGPLPRGE